MKIGFIFSLPRAGSTYVQRTLSGSPDIATAPEPWLLPALFGILTGESPLADFAYDHVRAGLNDTLMSLDDGANAWRQSIAAMVQSLYGNFASDQQIFIDKTPRNAPFVMEILRTFPDAPILFIWRNPAAIVASINRTWGKDRWKAYFYHYDLYLGMRSLIECARVNASNAHVKCIRYEDLVYRPDLYWPQIFSHFNVRYSADAVARPPKIISTMGDKTGQIKYDGANSASIDNWQSAFGGKLRKRWLAQYLTWIGDEDLEFMGYNKNAILEGITRKGDCHWTDPFYILGTPAFHRIEPFIFRGKLSRDGVTGYARR